MKNSESDITGVKRACRLMKKELLQPLTQGEREFLRDWDSTHAFNVVRNGDRLEYANKEQYRAAILHNARVRQIVAMLPDAQTGRKITTARKNGTAATIAKKNRSKALFLKAFANAQRLHPEHVKDGHVTAAIDALKVDGVRIGRRTAWGYLMEAQKRSTAKAKTLQSRRIVG